MDATIDRQLAEPPNLPAPATSFGDGQRLCHVCDRGWQHVFNVRRERVKGYAGRRPGLSSLYKHRPHTGAREREHLSRNAPELKLTRVR